MSDRPLHFQTATELAGRIRSGQVRAVEVVDAHLRQIERWNPTLQALVSLRQDEARREAEAADQARRDGKPLGPLHGVPITLKDSLRVAGVRSTFGGLPLYARYVPKTDCQVMARLRQAGVIVLGRSNLPLLALNYQCDNPFYKEGKNPWDLTRTPGGSSGGAAAALAAGFAALELGSDLGGSIRVPAHFCGVLGLRTTVGLLPVDDIGPEGLPMSMGRLLSLGPMARSLDDLALMLDVLTAGQAAGPGPAPLAADRLRIAVTPALPGAEPDAATSALLSTLCDGLRADGHQVDIGAAPDVDMQSTWRIWGLIAGYEYWSGLPARANNRLSRYVFTSYMLKHKLGDGPMTQWFAAGMTATRAAYEEALAQQQAIFRQLDAFFDRYAVWLLPVCMGEAIVRQRRGSPIQVDAQVDAQADAQVDAQAGAPGGAKGGKRSVLYSQYLGAYNVPTTVFETPALTLPIGLSAHGLPIGIQVHGPRFADRRLLDVANRAFAKFVSVRVPPLLQPQPPHGSTSQRA